MVGQILSSDLEHQKRARNVRRGGPETEMQWGKQQKLAVEAITAGDFQSALKHLKRDRFQNTATGQRVARRLTFALVERAEHCTATGNLHQAWSDLMLASSISIPRDIDAISRKKNQLVELTVETAETFLAHGQVTHALRAIDELASRQIMDWRADRLTKTANLLLGADESAATGQLADSVQQLEQAKNLHPELGFIESRLAASRQRQMQVRDLTSVLQEKTVKGDWAEVRLCCQKLLAIAPKYRLALDAQKHCLAQMQRPTSVASCLTQIPSRVSGDSFFRIDDDANEVDTEDDTAELRSRGRKHVLVVGGWCGRIPGLSGRQEHHWTSCSRGGHFHSHLGRPAQAPCPLGDH